MDRIMATVVGPTGYAAINAVRDEIERHVSRLDEGWARGYLSVLSDDVSRVLGEPPRHVAARRIQRPNGTGVRSQTRR